MRICFTESNASDSDYMPPPSEMPEDNGCYYIPKIKDQKNEKKKSKKTKKIKKKRSKKKSKKTKKIKKKSSTKKSKDGAQDLDITDIEQFLVSIFVIF
jgi:hypothetical protein